MNRKTQSVAQALERMQPFAEDFGWTIESIGGGKWEAMFWPSEEWSGVQTFKARPLFIRLAWHLAVSHPDPEMVRQTIRWYGDIPKLQRAQKIHHKHLLSLKWLNIDEQYDDCARPEMPVQVYNEAGIR
tara:strand:+ start:9923 stop:10309 length:387 start_codon:yes stop_codon:yes gene_type:complete